jgi:ribonuclease E
MSNKMLIDAAHPEETRVVVLRGDRVEEFDFEASDRRPLRGNIYLAKVTRVEPSLQAAFIEYGGNRHGFLAFSEIHPDYYQIPVADRQALLEEDALSDAEEAAEDDIVDEKAAKKGKAANKTAKKAKPGKKALAANSDTSETVASEPSDDEDAAQSGKAKETDENLPDEATAEPEEADVSDESSDDSGDDSGENNAKAADAAVSGDAANPSAKAEVDDDNGEANGDDAVEQVGAEDALEELPRRRKPRPRQYKIQEVIKRRQVLLVQVVKEERGTKGAALTTYLSLAGRYSVLMPNTARGGGISRKITNPGDRKRLKEIATELDVPNGIGVILRTAGASRTKAEIKRDFEYLLRLWETVRELTLKSTAPTLVYEEGNLVKRSIRDLYSKEIENILVAGDEGYREAKDFMRMLMPSHAKNVQPYKEETPIFSRYGVESQLDAMFSTQVTLKSGGYIVINQTEALVAIDVNSGRSTREHSIEDTALQTNLQAADEVARQLRLRDLAGLIVIDFIDMEENRNNRAVEKKIKDCLKADRARIQVGRISHFGLLEMSRQRIRTGVLESSTEPCSLCHGTGQLRSVSSLALQILRSLDDQLLRNATHHLKVRTRPDAALYILNHKRFHLAELEARFGLSIEVTGEPPENGSIFVIEKGEAGGDEFERPTAALALHDFADEKAEEAKAVVETEAGAEENGDGRKRRRRRRRPRSEEKAVTEGMEAPVEGKDTAGADAAEAAGEAVAETEDGDGKRKRRRGRRGGRRRGRSRETESTEAESQGNGEDEAVAAAAGTDETPQEEAVEGLSEAANGAETASTDLEGSESGDEIAVQPADESDESTSEPHGETEPEVEPDTESAAEPELEPVVEDDKPKRGGWWQKRSFL